MNRSLSIGFGMAIVLCWLAVPAFGQSFSNTNSITINAEGPASSYPSTINVSGLSGPIDSMTLQVNGISHTFSDDMSALVVGPDGANVVLWGGPGDAAMSNLTWLFDDAAAAALPTSGVLTSGSFQPGQRQYADDFSAFGGGAPAAPYGTSFATAFDGTDPNGNWSLFVGDFFDDTTSGSISGGWSLSFTLVPEPSSLSLALLAIPALLRRRRVA